MQVIATTSGISDFVKQQKESQHSIAIVPTMGGLHKGHLALIASAISMADVVIVSLFVNPAQFGVNEDLDSYPANLAQDLALLHSYKIAAVFTPDIKDIYPLADSFAITAPDIANYWCGSSRPDFFHGISLVILKLLILINPDIAVFGKKDYQQLHIIKLLVKDFLLNIKVVGIDTIRESDGLACSTRNKYFDTKDRKIAPIFYQTILETKAMLLDNKSIIDVKKYAIDKLSKNFSVDYFAIINGDNLLECASVDNNMIIIAAVLLGKIRLIDNIKVQDNV